MLDELYRETIIQRYQAPRHRGPIADPDARGSENNPLCGDEMSIEARREAGRIAAAGFEARGCSISQASADMMVDAILGKSQTEIEQLATHFRDMMTSDLVAEDVLGELIAFQGVKRFPSRIKCALLPWDTLARALHAQDAR